MKMTFPFRVPIILVYDSCRRTTW